MTKYNPKNLLPAAVGGVGVNFGTRGNSYVSDWRPDGRILDTAKYWTLTAPVTFTVGEYATGNSVYVLAQLGGGYLSAAKYATASSYPSTSWTIRTAPANQFNSLIFHNGYFLGSFNSGTGNGLLAYSTDAVTWTTAASGGTGSSRNGMFSRYNYGLSRYEACTLAVEVGGADGVYSAINAPTSWSFTSGATLAGNPWAWDQVNNDYFVFGTTSGELAYGTPGPYATTYLAAPAGTSPGIVCTGIVGQGISMGGSQYYAIINGNLYAATAANGAVPPSSWTLINMPDASAVAITIRSKGTAQNIVIATGRGRVWVANHGGSPNTSNLNWTEISPPMNSYYTTNDNSSSYKLIQGINVFGRDRADTGANIVEGLYSTSYYL